MSAAFLTSLSVQSLACAAMGLPLLGLARRVLSRNALGCVLVVAGVAASLVLLLHQEMPANTLAAGMCVRTAVVVSGLALLRGDPA